MGYQSEPRTLVLLGMRLKNFAEAPAIAESWGLDAPTVEAIAQELGDAGLAKHREGRVSGWTLTPEGRSAGEQALAAELDEAGCRAGVQNAYERFLALNQRFLSVCTRWQVKDADANLLNDHTDPEYDAAVVAELGELDVSVQPIVADLATDLDRFAGLGPRFTTALTRVRAGETDWFTKPLIDSYHTVWFDLHETLLATLGIDRASEKAH